MHRLVNLCTAMWRWDMTMSSHIVPWYDFVQPYNIQYKYVQPYNTWYKYVQP